MVFGKNKKITNRNGGPLDPTTAVTSVTPKNALRYLAGVTLNELSETEEESLPVLPDKRSIIINSENIEKEMFSWYKTTEDNKVVIKTGGEYTKDGQPVYIHEIFVQAGEDEKIRVWPKPVPTPEDPEPIEFDTFVEKEESDYTLYTIYSDCRDMLGKSYYRIVYTYSNEDINTDNPQDLETYELNYIDRKNIKFVDTLNPVDDITIGKVKIGKNGEYYVMGCYVLDPTEPENTDEDEVEKIMLKMQPISSASDIIALMNTEDFIVLAVDYTDSYGQTTDYKDYFPQYLYYNFIKCDTLPEYSQPDSSELPGESSLGDCAVRIPLHAKKAILEVSAYSKPYEKQIEPEEEQEEPVTVIVQDDYEFGVYTAPSFNQLKTPGAFNVDSEIYESSEYSSTNYQPTFKSGANNVLNPGVDSSTGINEVQLLGVKSPRSSSIVEVPMYIEPKTGKLMFSLRLANIKPSPDNSFVVKLIGYSM